MATLVSAPPQKRALGVSTKMDRTLDSGTGIEWLLTSEYSSPACRATTSAAR